MFENTLCKCFWRYSNMHVYGHSSSSRTWCLYLLVDLIFNGLLFEKYSLKIIAYYKKAIEPLFLNGKVAIISSKQVRMRFCWSLLNICLRWTYNMRIVTGFPLTISSMTGANMFWSLLLPLPKWTGRHETILVLCCGYLDIRVFLQIN